MLQFVSLEGKILKTDFIKANITGSKEFSDSKWPAQGNLAFPIRLRNIPQKGFACFYGDEVQNALVITNTKGDILRQKRVTSKFNAYYLLVSGTNIYLLGKQNYVTGKTAVIGGYVPVNNEGGYELTTYNAADSTVETHFKVKDTRGNELKILTFENDEVTGKAYLAGCIIRTEKQGKYASGRALSRGPYLGLFTIDLNGPSENSYKKTFSYWSDGSSAGISTEGKFEEQGFYVNYTTAFKGFDGNTYFSGSAMIRRVRWGYIISSFLTSPIIVPPIWILSYGGTAKCKVTDALILKQDDKGSLAIDNIVTTQHGKFSKSIAPLTYLDNKTYFRANNVDAKASYLIIDDSKNILFYNVNNKKVSHSIKRVDGDIVRTILPAKEGHVMVFERDYKQKTQRFSIEAL